MLNKKQQKNFLGEKELFKKLKKLFLQPQIIMTKFKNIKDFMMKLKKELKEFLTLGKTLFLVLILHLNSVTIKPKLL